MKQEHKILNVIRVDCRPLLKEDERTKRIWKNNRSLSESWINKFNTNLGAGNQDFLNQKIVVTVNGEAIEAIKENDAKVLIFVTKSKIFRGIV